MKTIDPAKIDALDALIEKAELKKAEPEREKSYEKKCVCSCCGASCTECSHDGEEDTEVADLD